MSQTPPKVVGETRRPLHVTVTRAIRSTPLSPPSPPGTLRFILQTAGYGLLITLAILLIGYPLFSTAMLAHIIRPEEQIEFLEFSDGQPIPLLLNWNLGLLQALLFGRELPIPILILGGIALLGILWLGLVGLINPTFQPFHRVNTSPPVVPMAELIEPETTGKPADETQESSDHPEVTLQESALLSAPFANAKSARSTKQAGDLQFNTHHLVRAFRLLIPLGLPLVVAALVAVRAPADAVWRMPLLLLILSGALVLGAHSEGMAGDFRREDDAWQRPAPGLILPVLLITLGLTLAVSQFPVSLEALLDRFQMLGAFNRETFQQVATICIFTTIAVSLSAALLIMSLGRAGVNLTRRLVVLLLGTGLAISAYYVRQPITPGSLAEKYDITPEAIKAISVPFSPKRPNAGTPDGLAGGRLLAKLAGIPLGIQPEHPSRNLVLFYPKQSFVVGQLGITEDGESADPAYITNVRRYLEKRNYRTAVSWTATKHMFYTGLVNFDSTAAVDALLLDLTHCPHANQFGGTLRSLFFTCTPSEQNRKRLDLYADSNNFAWPDRFSTKMMGDLYIRFGDREKALNWYRRAEMPRSFMNRIKLMPMPLRKGEVRGQLMLNGKPAAGLSVAIMPIRTPGLPRDIAEILPQAERELVPNYAADQSFGLYEPKPWAFRHLAAGAVTDRDGRFRISELGEGQYLLITSLPPSLQLALPEDSKLSIQNGPRGVLITQDHPIVDTGAISFRYTGKAAIQWTGLASR